MHLRSPTLASTSGRRAISSAQASDGACYVTKFQNNPQHIRVLANEMLATNLGLALGLPMPRVEVIEVSDWLIKHTEDLRISLGGSKIPCQSGKQLGSLYVGRESPGMTFDYLPRELLEGVRNLSDFARVLVLDKWTCNSDGRQAIFVGKRREASDTPQPLLTKATASMPASGRSRIVRSEVYTRTIVFTRVSRDGRHSNQR